MFVTGAVVPFRMVHAQTVSGAEGPASHVLGAYPLVKATSVRVRAAAPRLRVTTGRRGHVVIVAAGAGSLVIPVSRIQRCSLVRVVVAACLLITSTARPSGAARHAAPSGRAKRTVRRTTPRRGRGSDPSRAGTTGSGTSRNMSRTVVGGPVNTVSVIRSGTRSTGSAGTRTTPIATVSGRLSVGLGCSAIQDPSGSVLVTGVGWFSGTGAVVLTAEQWLSRCTWIT